MANVPFLSEAWLELHRSMGAELPERPGASGRVQHIVTGTPNGEVRYVHTIVDGRTAALELGGDEDADVTFTNTHHDAVALARSELDPSVLFMQGRTKMAGDMGTVLGLMPVTRSDEQRRLRTLLSDQTAY